MNSLGLFARYPEPGQTKTRLAATIGDAAAAELYECFVRDLVERTRNVADRLVIAATPETRASHMWFELLRSDDRQSSLTEIIFQAEGDLGARLRWFFDQQQHQSRAATVLLGTDSPDLPTQHIHDAFDALRSPGTDVVLSPATDGGFVLIGMKGRPGTLFEDIRWSTSSTLADTLASAERDGLRTALLEPWYDIDQLADLGTLAALQKDPGRSGAAPCPLTCARLKQLPPAIREMLRTSPRLSPGN